MFTAEFVWHLVCGVWRVACGVWRVACFFIQRVVVFIQIFIPFLCSLSLLCTHIYTHTTHAARARTHAHTHAHTHTHTHQKRRTHGSANKCVCMRYLYIVLKYLCTSMYYVRVHGICIIFTNVCASVYDRVHLNVCVHSRTLTAPAPRTPHTHSSHNE